MTDPEIAMIVLAGIIALLFGTPFMGNIPAVSTGGVVTTFVFHVTILSLGIHYASLHTSFISYMCWSWTYLVSSALGATHNMSSIARGLGGIWWLAILGTAIASAVENTGADAMDNNALCIFGLVTTVLMYIPVLARILGFRNQGY